MLFCSHLYGVCNQGHEPATCGMTEEGACMMCTVCMCCTYLCWLGAVWMTVCFTRVLITLNLQWTASPVDCYTSDQAEKGGERQLQPHAAKSWHWLVPLIILSKSPSHGDDRSHVIPPIVVSSYGKADVGMSWIQCLFRQLFTAHPVHATVHAT